MAPLLNAGLSGLLHGLMLHALPGYLDILPLYVVLLACFPLALFAMRCSMAWTLGTSDLVWSAANLHPDLNLPNWLDAEG